MCSKTNTCNPAATAQATMAAAPCHATDTSRKRTATAWPGRPLRFCRRDGIFRAPGRSDGAAGPVRGRFSTGSAQPFAEPRPRLVAQARPPLALRGYAQLRGIRRQRHATCRLPGSGPGRGQAAPDQGHPGALPACGSAAGRWARRAGLGGRCRDHRPKHVTQVDVRKHGRQGAPLGSPWWRRHRRRGFLPYCACCLGGSGALTDRGR